MEIAYTLYRVSTKKQVDKEKNDIPMQKEACREFARQQGWVIGKEFLEKGVSGFKVSAENRDTIQDLKAAAIRGEFQILLVFMFDRIGRIDDETPFVVEWFVKHGIKVWSVQEGEQRFESHVDKLMNYIRFWQASGESEKTSMRIKTRMQQLTAEGSYTGGPVPFGYQLEKRGRLNKRGKEIYDLAVNPVEAEWVVQIFEKTVKEGYGTYRIASYLNQNGVRTHNGSKFQSNTISRILRNKLFCGYIVSGEAVSPHMKELQIIDAETFTQAQYILDQRAKKNDDERQIALTTKSKNLLSGMMYCAHCGGRLTSIVYKDHYTRQDGTEYRIEQLKYLCYHKSRKLCKCDGQSTYVAAKVDGAVCTVIQNMFCRIGETPDEDILNKRFQKEMASCRAKQTKLNLELRKHTVQLQKLEDEIANTLSGDSFYTPEQLSKAIKAVEGKVAETNTQLQLLHAEMSDKKSAIDQIKPMYERFKGWSDEFNRCSIEQKKMIISQLVTRIEISKGYKITVELNMDYEQFCKDWDTLQRGSVVIA